MAKKRRQSSINKDIWVGVITILSVIVIILLVMVLSQGTNQKEDKVLLNEGYETTDEEDAFYKKITTNNTLDDFYNDMANKQNSAYEEYYFAKESHNFIELKMNYNEGAITTLNITSDLKTQEVKYNYELSYNSAHLILEGNSLSDYSCQIVTKKNVNDTAIQNHCDYVMQEINVFLERRQQLLQNDKVREIVNSPMKEYVEE